MIPSVSPHCSNLTININYCISWLGDAVCGTLWLITPASDMAWLLLVPFQEQRPRVRYQISNGQLHVASLAPLVGISRWPAGPRLPWYIYAYLYLVLQLALSLLSRLIRCSYSRCSSPSQSRYIYMYARLKKVLPKMPGPGGQTFEP